MTLNLAAYLYGIKDTHPDYAAALRSAAQTKIVIVSSVIVELEDEGKKSNKTTVLSIRIKKTKWGAWQGCGSNSGCGRGIRSGGQLRTQEVSSHYDHPKHFESNRWNKYPEKAIKSHMRDNVPQKGEFSKFSGKEKRD